MADFWKLPCRSTQQNCFSGSSLCLHAQLILATYTSSFVNTILLLARICLASSNTVSTIFAWIASLKHLVLARSLSAELLLLLFVWPSLLLVSIWLTYWIFLDLILFSRVGKVQQQQPHSCRPVCFATTKPKCIPLQFSFLLLARPAPWHQCSSVQLRWYQTVK